MMVRQILTEQPPAATKHWCVRTAKFDLVFSYLFTVRTAEIRQSSLIAAGYALKYVVKYVT